MKPLPAFQLPPQPAMTSSTSPPPLCFEHTGKHFQVKTGHQVDALADIDLTVGAGEICGIIGRSGAGKSTLLRLINRLETPTRGTVRVQGTDISTLDEEALVQLRRRVGMIFQHFNLLSAKTVWENIALPLRVTGMARSAIEQRVSEVLALVGLQDKRHAYPAQLSGGQKQRVGIARALVHGPGILLSDEATSALDPETTAAILTLLRDINRRLGLTIVLITHEMSVIRAICDTVVVLDQGRIVERGRVADVFGAPRHPVTQALLSPLMHELPPRLLADLQAAPPADPAATTDVLLSLRYTGQESKAPDLAAIGRAADLQTGTGPGADSAMQLLHANLDHLQDKVIGQLVLKLRSSAGTVPERLAALRRIHANLEVLGYVQPTA